MLAASHAMWVNVKNAFMYQELVVLPIQEAFPPPHAILFMWNNV